ADGGCEYCVRELYMKFIENFPEYTPLAKRKFAEKFNSNLTTDKETKELIKTTIKKVLSQFNIKLRKIILFGSRARGDHKKDSDWDCFVIVNSDLDREKKRKIIAKIKMELACFGIPNDIIIQSFRVVEERKNDVGYLTYYVLKEGIEI
ncbi:nucleotidyltransferase domain-containing protein, partial [Candidatus Aerophobetes bacterium]|nr:nucleotidyltransferase domain-containing protein [Candidatus Aerophobetes bacterium]